MRSAKALKIGVYKVQIRVYYEDTDAGGIVYHSAYLNFCERARSELFFQRGLSPVLESGHFVAKRVEADYISSARLGDLLCIETKLLVMKGASFDILQNAVFQPAFPSAALVTSRTANRWRDRRLFHPQTGKQGGASPGPGAPRRWCTDPAREKP